MTGSPNSSTLDVFSGARHQTRESRSRRFGLLAVGIFSVVALLALASNDRSPDGLATIDLDGDGVNAPLPGEGPDDVAGFFTGDGSPGGGPSAGRDSAPGIGADQPAGSGTGSDDPFTAPPGAPGSEDVAVVSGVLKTFAFGSQVGLPLICNVAAGTLISGVSDPALAEVVGTIASSCVEFGNQGAVALAALNEQLAALAVINPAVAPLIVSLADTFNTAGNAEVPFAEALLSIGELIRFFTGTS
jgi:hypothetical protein